MFILKIRNMKKIILLSVIFIGFSFLSSCEKTNNPQLNKSKIEYKKVNGFKHVFAYNITNKSIVKAQDGVICFFNVDDSKNTYSNAITLIPIQGNEINKINKFLQNKELTFNYEINHMLVNSENSSFVFVVDNEEGVQFANEYSGNAEIIHLQQMSFIKQNNFKLNDCKNSNETNMPVNKYVRSTTRNFRTAPGSGNGGTNCTSGGPGSSSCSVGDVWSSCSVSCSASFYACCHGDSNTCECIPKVDAVTHADNSRRIKE